MKPEAVKKSNFEIVQDTLLRNKNVLAEIARKLEADEPTTLEYLGNIITAVREAPEKVRNKLVMCTPESYLAAARHAIDLGLKIDHNQHGFLVPYGNRAKFTPSWRGFLKVARDDNPTIEVRIGLCMNGDSFTIYDKDGRSYYEHHRANPFESNYDNVTGAYCYMEYERHGKIYSSVETMGIAEIMQVRSCAKDDYIWNAWTGEQIKKTILRRALKQVVAGRTDKIARLEQYDNQEYDLTKLDKTKQLTNRFMNGDDDTPPEDSNNDTSAPDAQGGDSDLNNQDSSKATSSQSGDVSTLVIPPAMKGKPQQMTLMERVAKVQQKEPEPSKEILDQADEFWSNPENGRIDYGQ